MRERNRTPSQGQPAKVKKMGQRANYRPKGKHVLPVGRAATSVVALTGSLVIGGLYWHSHRSAKLTDKDTIVIADFTNTTGDTVFDGTLRQGLSFQLEQSPFLSIISDEQVQQTLQMMNQRPDAKLILTLRGRYARGPAAQLFSTAR